jgi:hypothetical protein
LAFLLPAAASASMRERRTPTSANSAATKNPFARTSTSTAESLMMAPVASAVLVLAAPPLQE